MAFFEPGEAQDDAYLQLRYPTHPFAEESRTHLEQLWAMAEPFTDLQLPRRARRSFHAAYWEVYLTAALLDAGLPLAARGRRHFRGKGPDLQVGMRPKVAWVEATASTPGAGVDHVREAGNRVRAVPDDQIKLRLLASIDEKKAKYDHYVASGLVDVGEPFIIAINGAMVPSAQLELALPRIVRCVYPFGHEVLELDLKRHAITGSHYEFTDCVGKASGATVSTDWFGRIENAGTSAVLYSCADVWNPPQVLGADFVLVHNPLATNPLPRGFLKRGREYWAEKDELRWQHHGASRSACGDSRDRASRDKSNANVCSHADWLRGQGD